MKNIVIYSTRKGFSKKIAELVGSKLKGKTDIVDIKEGCDLSSYDTVVLGGAVIAGEIRNGMYEFTEKHLAELMQKKVALFLCCSQEKPEEVWDYVAKSFHGDLIKHSIACESLGRACYMEKENRFMRIFLKILKVPNGEVIREKNLTKLVKALNN